MRNDPKNLNNDIRNDDEGGNLIKKSMEMWY